RIAKGIVGERARRSDKSVRGVKDNKYQLSRTHYRYVPLTPIQATRINANVRDGARWLSPRQKAYLDLVRADPKAGWPDLLGVELRAAWAKAEAAVARG
ncbi:MAG: thioredoxin family (seleno)protein, partial [Planctomycetota bacterium]